MKITQTKGNIVNAKVFKPVQYINVQGHSPAEDGPNDVQIRVRLISSDTGKVEDIIPSMNLSLLGEISSMNEGFYISDSSHFSVNVMLHPTSAIYLSNDKYLEIEVECEDSDMEITLYGIENALIDKNFVCRYNKFYMAAGELQKSFVVGQNENLILPISSFEEVVLSYKNGSSCTFTAAELEALMILKNDIVCVSKCDQRYTGGLACDNVFGYETLFGLDVDGVDSFTIRRSEALTSFEIIMIDTIKD